MDITPVISHDKKIIQAYSKTSFKVSDQRYHSSIIIFPSHVIEWKIINFDEINMNDFSALQGQNVEILLIGYGFNARNIKSKVKNSFKSYNVEIMNTAAACRTYNILLAEGRIVAAALILSD